MTNKRNYIKLFLRIFRVLHCGKQEKYQIVFNNEEFDRLKKIGHDGELNRFINNIKPYINVPPAVKDRPHVDYIIESNKIRGWELYR